MISENILLFPKLVTIGKREVDELEKESWFSSYLEQSNKDGKSQDCLGFQSVHHDKRFMKVFSDIANTIRNHLNTLGIDTNKIDINITKSFFNVTKNNGNPLHNHVENHISFTYYPHIHENCKQQLVFHQDIEKISNDPYEGFLNHMSTYWNDINAMSYSLAVQEGNIFVFPSKLCHSVNVPGVEFHEIESFKTTEDLKLSRFCVVGDAILTRRNDYQDRSANHRLLTPIENWRKF